MILKSPNYMNLEFYSIGLKAFLVLEYKYMYKTRSLSTPFLPASAFSPSQCPPPPVVIIWRLLWMKTGSIFCQRLLVVRFEVNTRTRAHILTLALNGLQDIFHDCKVSAFPAMSPSFNFLIDFSICYWCVSTAKTKGQSKTEFRFLKLSLPEGSNEELQTRYIAEQICLQYSHVISISQLKYQSMQQSKRVQVTDSLHLFASVKRCKPHNVWMCPINTRMSSISHCVAMSLAHKVISCVTRGHCYTAGEIRLFSSLKLN